ncbi:hypothetical protein, partial [Corynebacterium simulans]
MVEGGDGSPGGGVAVASGLPNQNPTDDWFGGVGSECGYLVFELLEPFGPLGFGDVFDLDAKKTG